MKSGVPRDDKPQTAGGRNAGRRVRFGRWQVELESGELWNGGAPVRLQPQPAKVLCLLVGRAGQLVTREEIHNLLWDSRAQLDFDAGLNYCIRQIRSVLGDTSASPQFIATIPRRGYRFLPAVTPVLDDAAGSPALPEQPIGSAGISTRRVSLWAAVIFVAAACSLWFYSNPPSRSANPPRVRTYRRLTNDGRQKDIFLLEAPILSDGGHIFFTETVDNQSVLGEVDSRGGETVSRAVPFPQAGLLDFSRSRQQLLFGSIWESIDRRSIEVQSIAGGRAYELRGISAQDASWSADGKRLAFADGHSVFVAEGDGSRPRRLATVDGVTSWLRWSPDGQSVAFSEKVLAGVQHRVWQVGIDGGLPQRLLTGSRLSDQVCCGSWMDRGKYFVFVVVEAGRTNIWITRHPRHMDQAVQLTSGALDYWRGVSPEAEDHRILAMGEQLEGRLMRIDPSSRRPSMYLNGISAEGVAFSPDSKWIAYTDFPDGTLSRSTAAHTGKLRLTERPMIARYPRWSPDGHTIAFIGSMPGGVWKQYLIDWDGSNLHLLNPEDSSQGVPSWSPDGKSFAFGGVIGRLHKEDEAFGIHIKHLRSGATETLPDSQGLWTARWSPDGSYVAAVTIDDNELRLFDFKSRAWRHLASAEINDVVWSPDSRYIFFDTRYGAQPKIYRVRVADDELETWADLAGFRRAAFFGPWLGIDDSGAPILLEDVGVQEIYRMELDLTPF